jgi:hypothetical protein
MEMKFNISDLLMVIACIILAWLMTACKTSKLPVMETINNTEIKHDSTANTTTEITTNETIKESDVAHSVDADSAYAALQFRCDSLGNVLLVALEQEQGKRTSLELQLKDNILKIQAIQEQFEVIVKGLKRDKEVLIKENTELKEKLSSAQLKEKQEPVIVEKPIPAIMRWLAWIGAAAILYVLIRIGLWVYRKFFLKV